MSKQVKIVIAAGIAVLLIFASGLIALSVRTCNIKAQEAAESGTLEEQALQRNMAYILELLAAGNFQQALNFVDNLIAESLSADGFGYAELHAMRERILRALEIETMVNELLAGGNYQQALDLIDNLLAEDPDSPELLALRERVLRGQRLAAEAAELFAAGDFDQALDIINRLLAENPNNPELLALRDRILREQRLAADAAAAAEAAAAAAEAAAAQEREEEARTAARQRAEETRLQREADEARRKAEADEMARASRELQEQMRVVNELVAQGRTLLERGDIAGGERAFADARTRMPRNEPRFEAMKLAEMAEAWYGVFARSPASAEGREAARKAEALAGESVTRDRTQALPHFTIGKIGRDMQDWGKAVNSFAEAVRLDAANQLYALELSRSHMEQGRAHFSARRFNEARVSFETVVRLTPNSDQGWYNLGGTHRQLGRDNDALTAFRRAIGIRPDYWQAHREIGRILRARRDFRGAIEAFNNALTHNPGDIATLRELGQAQSESGNFTAAEASFARALEAAGDHAETNYNMAVVKLGLRKNSEALTFARNALNSNPSNHVYAYTVGLAHEALGETGQAISAYQNAATLDARYVRPRINLGKILHEQNRFDEALRYLFDEAYMIEPGNFEVNNNLGAVYAKMENWGNSVEHYERAIRAENNHPTVHLNLARAYIGAGDFAKAKTSLETVLRLAPNNWDALFELGKTCITLGLPDDAKTHLESLLNRNPSFHARAEAERLLAGL